MLNLLRLIICSLIIITPAAYSQLTSTPEIPESLLTDKDLIDRYWAWLKTETNAPDDLPWPSIVVEKLPSNLRMFLNYPTVLRPGTRYEIRISERAITRARNGQRLLVVSELAHELTHHVLLQKENGWVFSRNIYNIATHNHCDAEFQRLANHISKVIWHAYHSNNLIRAVEQMTRKACWESGHMLSEKD